VARELGWTLLAVVLAGGLACADVDESVDAGARRDANGPLLDAGLSSAHVCTASQVVRLDLQPADVLILLDRSGSMDTAFGSGTRLQAVAALLADVVAAYAGHVRFGFEEMPGRQGCEGFLSSGCCASPPIVAVGDGNAGAVLDAIAVTAPADGNTPTAAALRAARTYYEGLADPVDNRFVLLATDGAPGCTLGGALASGDSLDSVACVEAVAEVSALVARGVRVIVLGVGPELADDSSAGPVCLDALAHAGGAAASPGSPGYYGASDPEQLQLAIERVFGGVSRPSCLLPIRTPVPDTSTIAVYLDGQQIPRKVGDGWSLETSQSLPTVLVTGAYCEQIERFEVSAVEARFGCPPCVDIGECK
jgi:hypothetical protein